MAPDKQRIKTYLTTFNFQDLFREELGWDNFKDRLLPITYKEQNYILKPLAEKRGFKVYICDPDAQGHIPDDKTLKQIDRLVEPYAREHLIIYIDTVRENQAWQWVKHEPDKSPIPRINKLHKGQSGEALAQKLLPLYFDLREEDELTTLSVAGRAKSAFDVEKVTKKFYDRFQKEHEKLLPFIQGIAEEENRKWYVSLMLNRLMFIYFIEMWQGTPAPSGAGRNCHAPQRTAPCHPPFFPTLLTKRRLDELRPAWREQVVST